MNIEELVKWGIDKLYLINNFDEFGCLECTKEYVADKIGWLVDFQDDLQQWNDLIHIVKEAESFIKFQGYYKNYHVDLMQIPTFNAESYRAMCVKEELLDFIEQESMKAKKDERLLGSSEIIESVFGKMKRLEHDQVKSGFTVFVLSLAAIVSDTTVEVVQKALETVSTTKIHEWFKNNIGRSVQAKRVQVNRLIKEGEQNQNPVMSS